MVESPVEGGVPTGICHPTERTLEVSLLRVGGGKLSKREQSLGRYQVLSAMKHCRCYQQSISSLVRTDRG
jgi:hypothetical protein